MTLRNMTVTQAAQHYKDLQVKRLNKAGKLIDDASKLPRRSSGYRVLMNAANRQYEKAVAYNRPMQQWQAERARKMLDEYGLRAAAGFLMAHGFTLELVVRILGLPQR